jgi:6-phospho-beta-glucosidase
MSLEAQGGSLFSTADPGWDPFEAPTGYHRVAVDAIRGLQSDHPHRLILNVPNGSAIEDLGPTDVVEVPCHISREGARPITIGSLPENLRALTLAVKQYERLTIAAALGRDADKAAFALMANPIVGNWDAARQFVRRLGESDPQHFPTFQ